MVNTRWPVAQIETDQVAGRRIDLLMGNPQSWYLM